MIKSNENQPCGAIASPATEYGRPRLRWGQDDRHRTAAADVAIAVAVTAALAQSRHTESIDFPSIVCQTAIVASAPGTVTPLRLGVALRRRWGRRKAIAVTAIADAAPLLRIQNAIGQWHMTNDRLRAMDRRRPTAQFDEIVDHFGLFETHFHYKYQFIALVTIEFTQNKSRRVAGKYSYHISLERSLRRHFKISTICVWSPLENSNYVDWHLTVDNPKVNLCNNRDSLIKIICFSMI